MNVEAIVAAVCTVLVLVFGAGCYLAGRITGLKSGRKQGAREAWESMKHKPTRRGRLEGA